MELLMDGSTDDRPPRRVSRRALLGWGIASGIVVTGGFAYAHFWGSSGRSTDLYTYNGHTQGVNALAWSPDGTRIASSSWDKTIQIWGSVHGNRLLTYSGHASSPQSVSWSPESTRLVSAGVEGSIQVWQAADGKRDWIYREYAWGDNGYSPNAAWSPDSTRIATVGFPALLPGGRITGTTMLWDATSGRRLLTYNDPLFSWRVAWSPESTRLATGGNGNQAVTVWPAKLSEQADQSASASGQSPNKIWGYQGDIATVYGLAWSPDGTRLASCGSKPIVLFASNGGVRIWNAANGQRVLTYTGHSQSVDLRALAWSPDGKYIASGGTDQIVQVWDAITGDHLLTYTGHLDQHGFFPDNRIDPYSITALAWSPDSTRIASGAYSGPIRVWKFSLSSS
jgi:WD40 repeat protein